MMHKNKTIFSLVIVVLAVAGTSALFRVPVAFGEPSCAPGSACSAIITNATGSVAIGTDTFSASKLRVAGLIESTTGGFVFPDGSIQTTAGSGVTSTPAGYVTPGTFNSVAGTGGNYTFPASIVISSTTSSSSGVIYKNSNRFIHDFVSAGKAGQNTFVGVNSGNFTMTGAQSKSGSYNTAVGYGTLTSNTSGAYNSAFGTQSLYSNDQGDENTAVGYQSLYSNADGSSNTALGSNSMYSNTSGTNNVGIGVSALRSNTSGARNVAIGGSSLYSNTSGNYNTSAGYESMYHNSEGTNNSAYGYQALNLNSTGNDNTAVGYQALTNNNGISNTALGTSALATNTSGEGNSATGYQALFNNATGSYNFAGGLYSLLSNTSGSRNTAVGMNSGYNTGLALSTMTSSTFLGYGANSSANGITNSTALGAGAQVTKSNQIVIGNPNVTETVLRGNIAIGTSTSNLILQIVSSTGVDVYAQMKSSVGDLNWGMWNNPGNDVNYYRGNHGFIGTGAVANIPFGIRAGGAERITVMNTGNVGVGTTTPGFPLTVGGKTYTNSLTVNGSSTLSGIVYMPRGDISVTSGNQNNVAVTKSFTKISSASGAFNITGIAGGTDGAMLIIWNKTGWDMTIVHDSANSTAANRIYTPTAGNLVTTGGDGAVTMFYDAGASRWVVTSFET